MLYIRTLKNNRIPARSVLVSGLILLLILIEIFANRSYADEILGVISGVYLIYLLISSKLQKNDFIITLLMLLVMSVGMIGNLCSNLVDSKFVIAIDIISEFKVLLVFWAFKYFVNEDTKRGIVKLLYRIAKIFIIVAFIFGIITIFVNTGMYTSKRYGLPSYQFIFPMAFQFFIVELLALYIMIEYKNIFKNANVKMYEIMSIISIISIKDSTPRIK